MVCGATATVHGLWCGLCVLFTCDQVGSSNIYRFDRRNQRLLDLLDVIKLTERRILLHADDDSVVVGDGQYIY